MWGRAERRTGGGRGDGWSRAVVTCQTRLPSQSGVRSCRLPAGSVSWPVGGARRQGCVCGRDTDRLRRAGLVARAFQVLIASKYVSS